MAVSPAAFTKMCFPTRTKDVDEAMTCQDERGKVMHYPPLPLEVQRCMTLELDRRAELQRGNVHRKHRSGPCGGRKPAEVTEAAAESASGAQERRRGRATRLDP
jgi:hypothetical protein